jgi:hypothetical protein
MVTDKFGTRWRIDFQCVRQEKAAVIRSVWMIRADEDFPRFVTCWVL